MIFDKDCLDLSHCTYSIQVDKGMHNPSSSKNPEKHPSCLQIRISSKIKSSDDQKWQNVLQIISMSISGSFYLSVGVVNFGAFLKLQIFLTQESLKYSVYSIENPQNNFKIYSIVLNIMKNDNLCFDKSKMNLYF